MPIQIRRTRNRYRSSRIDLAVVLYDIRSIHNVGSIFRTAEAAGAKVLYLAGVTPAPVDRFGRLRAPFAKVALGAEKSILWKKISSTPALLRALRKEGYKIFAVEQAKGSKPYFRISKIYRKIALIFGNEVAGLPPRILKEADGILEIPLAGKKESLNVSVAAGIVIFRVLY